MDVVDLRKVKSPAEYGGAARGLLLPVLVPLAGLYAAGVGIWRRIPLRGRDVGLPVVSVGSLVVGGTGKTPVCMHVARRFRDMGRRVCILSRGYRRKSTRSPLVVSDGRGVLAGVEEAGDEPYMMAQRLQGVAVVVGKDRHAAALEARDALGVDVLVLDDGFQARDLARNVDVLSFDQDSLRKSGALLPLGTLREGWHVIGTGHLVVVMLKNRDSRPSAGDLAKVDGARVFYAVRSEPQLADAARAPVDRLGPEGGRFAVVSGIGRPGAFEHQCAALGVNTPVSIRFGDHHWYDEDDAASITAIMGRYRCTRVLTTEKDVWKLPAGLREISLILVSEIDFLEPDKFWTALDSRLGVNTCLQ
jgi:tetraacyldisaccharide 4'-kinase